ncbi:CBO0543 family protein [Evansella sp. AB-rgal1]|uniref:CBO0543 family protein n=1 Tax=Evansella sp. AB-rgal1 TaxID=3242696 RepID=UPI00359DF1DE
MKHIVMVLLLLLLNLKYKTWRKLPLYSSALFYVSFVNILYYFVCQKKLVWEFESNNMPLPKVRVLQVFLGTPLLTLLCLSGLTNQQSFGMKIFHIVKCSLGSTLLEWLAKSKFDMISFYHRWNICWSGLIYFLQYLFSYLYTRSRFLTFILTILSTEMFVQLFKIPISNSMFKPAAIKEFFKLTFIVNPERD